MENSTNFGVDDDGHLHIEVKDGVIRSIDGETGEVLDERKAGHLERIPESEISKRDEMVRECVRLGMTIGQVREFSDGWRYPIGTYGQCWNICERLKLLKKTEKNRRQSLHREVIFSVLTRIAVDGKRCGVPMHGLDIEHKIGLDSRIRADARFKLGDRLYYLEAQASALTFVGWSQKIGKYVAHRNRVGEPFKVLLVFDERRNLSTVKRYCKEHLRRFPRRRLFLLAGLPDVERPVSSKVWQDHVGESVSLLDW